MITLHQGLELKPYKCTSDKLTIGIGRNIEDIIVNMVVGLMKGHLTNQVVLQNGMTSLIKT